MSRGALDQSRRHEAPSCASGTRRRAAGGWTRHRFHLRCAARRGPRGLRSRYGHRRRGSRSGQRTADCGPAPYAAACASDDRSLSRMMVYAWDARDGAQVGQVGRCDESAVVVALQQRVARLPARQSSGWKGKRAFLLYSSSTRKRWPQSLQRTQAKALPSPWLVSERYFSKWTPSQDGQRGRGYVTVCNGWRWGERASGGVPVVAIYAAFRSAAAGHLAPAGKVRA